LKILIGKNTLHLLGVKPIEDLCELKRKEISNKTSKGTMITRLIKAMVPIEYAMKIFSH
jgi:hypothetical protein